MICDSVWYKFVLDDIFMVNLWICDFLLGCKI